MFGCVRSFFFFFVYTLITKAGLQGQNHPESMDGVTPEDLQSSSNSDPGSTEEPDSLLLTLIFAAPRADRSGDRQFLLRFSFPAF